MKRIWLILSLIVLVGSSLAVQAKVFNFKVVAKPSSAIVRAVQSFTDRNSEGVGKVKITSADIQGSWALVWAESTKRKLDPAQYLLHKKKGQWKVLTMGTSLVGTGKEYKVPNGLQKKWNL